MVWLPDGERSLMIDLAVSTEYQPVPDRDRRTDRRTSCNSIVHAVHIILILILILILMLNLLKIIAVRRLD